MCCFLLYMTCLQSKKETNKKKTETKITWYLMGPTNMNTNLQQCVLLCAIWPGNRGFALRIIALFLRLRRVHFAVHD